MSFTPVVMHKAGHADEVADDPEQVAQYLWDGWTRGTPPVPPKTTSQLLADKADLVSGRVPDAQLPARLGQTELRAALGAVPWIGGEAVTAGKFRLSPTGQIIQRNADGTTRPSYDSTEAALWTPVSSGGASNALGTASNPVTDATAVRPTGLTSVWWQTAVFPTNFADADVWVDAA